MSAKAKLLIDKQSAERYDLKLFDFKPLKVQVDLLDSLIDKLKQKRYRLSLLTADKLIRAKIKRISRRITALQQLKYLLVQQALESQDSIIKYKSSKSRYRYEARFKFYMSTDLSKIKGYALLQDKGFYNRNTNPNGCVLDHRLSIHYGIQNNIAPTIIGHLANCEFLSYSDNLIKSSTSSVTLEQLLEEINNYSRQ